MARLRTRLSCKVACHWYLLFKINITTVYLFIYSVISLFKNEIKISKNICLTSNFFHYVELQLHCC